MNRYFTLALALVSMIGGARAEPIDFSYCTTCHGADGNGNLAIRAPRIAGMEPWYLKQQLLAFRAGRRGTHDDDAAGQEMRPMAAHLKSDADIEAAVALVGKFVPRRPPVTIAGNTARGKQLYGTCTACHGARGEGSQSLNAPALAARSDWYLVAQLENYMTARRGTHPKDTAGAQMRAAAAALPDRQAASNVVAYINTLR